MKHLRSIPELGVDGIVRILGLANNMAEVNRRPVPKVPELNGRTVVSLFFEDSTRTLISFETAAKSLSADTMTFSVSTSSVNKGESLKDTIETCQMQLDENLEYIRNLGTSLDAQRQNLAQEINEKNKTLAAKELELNTALAKAEAERARLEQLRKELEKTSQRVKDLEAELSKKERAVRELKEAIAKALAGFEKLDIKVEYRNGKVYVILPEKLLFASGSIDVDPKGREALIEIGKALNKQPDVQMAIEGHTDNIPMKGIIKDNWDLSVLRATSIARILIADASMNPKRIQAVGRGDTQPVAGNDTPEGRAKNRRTEIVLTPQLDKILEILNN
jgi:chemotaxis protein MotB